MTLLQDREREFTLRIIWQKTGENWQKNTITDYCLFRTNRYSVNSVNSAIRSRIEGIIFCSFRNQDKSLKNKITVNSVHSHSRIVPNERVLTYQQKFPQYLVSVVKWHRDKNDWILCRAHLWRALTSWLDASLWRRGGKSLSVHTLVCSICRWTRSSGQFEVLFLCLLLLLVHCVMLCVISVTNEHWERFQSFSK